MPSTPTARQNPADATRIVRAALVALIGLQLFAIGWLMQQPLRDYRSAERAVMINRATDALVNASLAFSAERGRTRAVLGKPHPINAVDAEVVAQRRGRADAQFAAGLAVLRDEPQPSLLALLSTVATSHADVRKAREANDAAAAQRRESRDPRLAEHWFETASRLLADIDTLMIATLLDPAVRKVDIYDILEVKLEASRMRAAAGAESSHLANVLRQGTGLSPWQRDRVVEVRARAAVAWDQLQRLVANIDAPELGAAVNKVRTQYVESFGALRNHVLDSSGSGGSYPVSIDEYTALSVTTIASINDLITATASVAEKRAHTSRNDARVVMASHVLLAVVATALVVWLAHFVYRNFRVPLERLDRALSGGEIALWDADVATGIVHLSKEWALMLGEPPHAITTSVRELKSRIHPEDRLEVLRVARKAVMEKIYSYRIEHRVKNANGRWIWLRSEGRVVELDAKGRPRRMSGLNIRIDERKQAEEALRRERERYRKLIEWMPDAIFINRGETIAYANPAAIHLLGADAPEQVIGNSIFRFVHPDEHATVRANIARRIQLGAGRTGTFERRYVRLDGSAIDLEMSGVEVVDDEGPARLFVARDVSVRNRIERERHEMRAFLDSLVENIPHMIVVKDATTLRYVRVNRAVEDLLGVERSGIIGRTDHEMFAPEQAKALIDGDRAALAGDGVLDIPDVSLETRTHGLRHLHTKKIPMRDPAGGQSYLLGISEDITERKQATEALRQAHDALSKRAAELAAANKQLESFSYSVSHDLRAPLRHIGGFAMMLEQRCRDRIDEGGQRLLQQINNAVRRMASLIDGLLEFARSGRGELFRSTVELDALVRDVVRDVDAQGPPRRIEWIIGKLPAVSGDPTLLGAVFANLIDNARKYTGQREDARIEISSVPGDGAEAVVCVRDNGVGFDPAYAHKLFTVFQRLHSDREFPGIGVGLASVQQIVQRHGGRVWAESAKGRGAAFFVALPAATPGPAKT